MAVIHHTTMTPTKLEVVAGWLPTQPWYRPTGRAPELAKVGGFRLDDPRGEVGIEFMAATDSSGDRPVTYHVPMAYRGAPLDTDTGLIGTSEHGVLGRRWIYDGAHDPVLLGQLLALLAGRAEPQAQSKTDTPDPTVTVRPLTAPATVDGSISPENTETHTILRVGAAAIALHRVLTEGELPADAAGVTVPWRRPDGATVRGVFCTTA